MGPTGSQSAIPVRPGNLLLLRERIVILSALGIVTLLSWVYLVDMASGMDGIISTQRCVGMVGEPWTAGYFTAMLVMWIIMMVGMMVPSAIPMALIFASIARKAAREGSPLAPTGIFVTGYVLIWSLFSLGATIAQWALDRMALLSPMMMINSQILGGLLLLTAGVYQLTPAKDACLRHCRSPMQFISSHWKTGRSGRLSDGHRTRWLLPRVLLDPNGTALLRRGDEPVVDRRSYALRPLGKSNALRCYRRTSDRWYRRGLGPGSSRPRIPLT